MKELEQFRADNMGELQKNIDRLVEIRDQPNDLKHKCPKCKTEIQLNMSSAARDKNRIEASKGIARHLGGLQPDKAVSPVSDQKSALDRKLNKGEQAELDAFLKDGYGQDPPLVS